MSRTEKTGGRPISLDQLLALSDEMAALVRAGIPLEQGLTALGHESPGKLGSVATRLADRLRSGREPGGDPAAGRADLSAGVAQCRVGRDPIRASGGRAGGSFADGAPCGGTPAFDRGVADLSVHRRRDRVRISVVYVDLFGADSDACLPRSGIPAGSVHLAD